MPPFSNTTRFPQIVKISETIEECFGIIQVHSKTFCIYPKNCYLPNNSFESEFPPAFIKGGSEKLPKGFLYEIFDLRFFNFIVGFMCFAWGAGQTSG